MAKNALITGGSGGIGYELARLYAADGYNVILVALNEQKLLEKAQEIEKDFGVEAHAIAQDLSVPGAAQAVIDAFDAYNIPIDALVNDAGFGIAGAFVDTPWQKQASMLAVNINVLTQLAHEFGARMAARGSGEILNVASLAAFMPGPYMSTYYASKAYVQEFTQGLHTELKPFGVKVSALCPGPVRTNFFKRAGFGKEKLMSAMGLPAGTVAHAGYMAVKANLASYVPGVWPKAAVLFSRLVPQIVMRNITGALQKPAGKKADEKYEHAKVEGGKA